MSRFQDLCLTRKTLKHFDGRALSVAQIEDYLLCAVHAPNHRLTQPWRFRVFCGESLTKFLVAHPHLEKLQQARVGALIYVSQLLNAKPEIAREDFAAVCAAIQNILLAATSDGVGSYWSTSSRLIAPELLSYVGVPETESVAGVVWLGYAVEESLPVSRRTFADRTEWK